MANTTNLNLVKPAGTDFALVSVINGNMDIIDSKVGAIPANESAQSQITALNNQISKTINASSYAYTSTDAAQAIYSAFSDGTSGTAYVTFASGYTGMAMVVRENSNYGSIVLHVSYDVSIYHYRKKGGTWSVETLASNNQLTNVVDVNKNSTYVGTSYLKKIVIGKLVNISGRFEITTSKPTGQSTYIFNNVPAPAGGIAPFYCDYADSPPIFVNNSGYITSNAELPTGWYDVQVTYTST